MKNTITLLLGFAFTLTLGCDLEGMVDDAVEKGQASPIPSAGVGDEGTQGVGSSFAGTGAAVGGSQYGYESDSDSQGSGEGESVSYQETTAAGGAACGDLFDCIIDCPDNNEDVCFDQCYNAASVQAVSLFSEMGGCFESSGCNPGDIDCLSSYCTYEINACADHSESSGSYGSDEYGYGEGEGSGSSSSSSSCPSGCQMGSVCCGPPFCGGDCVGAPCC